MVFFIFIEKLTDNNYLQTNKIKGRASNHKLNFNLFQMIDLDSAYIPACNYITTSRTNQVSMTGPIRRVLIP